MSVDQSQVINTFKSLKRQFDDLKRRASLSHISNELASLTRTASGFPDEISKIRRRGYSFAAYLENKIQALSEKWEEAQRDTQRTMETENASLSGETRQAELLIQRGDSADANTLPHLMPSIQNAVKEIEDKIKGAETRLKSIYDTIAKDIQQTVAQVAEINWYLEQKDEASFKFIAGESLFLACKAEWVATGKGKQDPDGILYLTDQRLLFEQKETTGKTLGLFGGKRTQELKWEIPLNQIESVLAENKGFFGGKDMLYFTLEAGAPFAKITVEVKGNAKCKFWAAQIQRMIAGETNDERAIKPDAEMLESLRNTPTECNACGGTLPRLIANQREVSCNYCGTVIRL